MSKLFFKPPLTDREWQKLIVYFLTSFFFTILFILIFVVW